MLEEIDAHALVGSHRHAGDRVEAARVAGPGRRPAGDALMNAECVPLVPAWNNGGELAAISDTRSA